MSSRRAAAQISGLLLHRRVFSTTTIALGGISRPPVNINHRNSVLQVRHCSSTQSWNITKEEKTAKLDSDNQGAGKAIVSSYWGVAPPKVTKEDGSPWRWNCFRPWETYKADTSIDVKKHHKRDTLMDKFAYWTVQLLKFPTYIVSK